MLTAAEITRAVFADASIRGRLMQYRLRVDAGEPPPVRDDQEFESLVRAWHFQEFSICPRCDSSVEWKRDGWEWAWEVACPSCGLAYRLLDRVCLDPYCAERELLAVVAAEVARRHGDQEPGVGTCLPA